MRLTVNSQIARCNIPPSGQLSAHQLIGVVTGLAINHSQYNALTVDQLVNRLALTLDSGLAKVFFDDAQHPYGYASWALVSEDLHLSLLSGENSEALLSPSVTKESKGNHLWFLDLLCPFCTPLFMLQALKQELNEHCSAHLLQNTPGNTAKVRRLW